MIVSLNLPDDIVAFIDQQATHAKLSRSAWVAGLLANIRFTDSDAGKKELARGLAAIMTAGAEVARGEEGLGEGLEQARQALTRVQDRIREAQGAPPGTPQLPAPPSGDTTTATPDAAVGTAPDSTAVTVTRRRPYQRGPATHQP